ncbi:hypothetical protein ACVXHA_29405, partial [Escherichia coli]
TSPLSSSSSGLSIKITSEMKVDIKLIACQTCFAYITKYPLEIIKLDKNTTLTVFVFSLT